MVVVQLEQRRRFSCLRDSVVALLLQTAGFSDWLRYVSNVPIHPPLSRQYPFQEVVKTDFTWTLSSTASGSCVVVFLLITHICCLAEILHWQLWSYSQKSVCLASHDYWKWAIVQRSVPHKDISLVLYQWSTLIQSFWTYRTRFVFECQLVSASINKQTDMRAFI